ncbi:MAG: hypothetical protein ACKPKO_45345, partial [Candidatus Fonsibacter sp.]
SARVASAMIETHSDVVSVADATISARGHPAGSRRHHLGRTLDKFADQGVSVDTIITLYSAQALQTTVLTGARKLALAFFVRPENRTGLNGSVELVGILGVPHVFWEEHSWANKRLMPNVS